MCWKCGQKRVIIHTYSLCSLTSLSHINKTFTTQTKGHDKMSNNGWRKCKYFGSMISFSSFFFLKEPLNNFSESFAVLFQQWTDAFPPCFVQLPHLLELSVLRPDDLLENRQCGEIGVSAQLSRPTDAAIAWQDGSILELSNTHACTRSHMCTYMHPRSCLWSHTHTTHKIGREIWGKQHVVPALRMCGLCLWEHLQMQ